LVHIENPGDREMITIEPQTKMQAGKEVARGYIVRDDNKVIAFEETKAEYEPDSDKWQKADADAQSRAIKARDEYVKKGIMTPDLKYTIETHRAPRFTETDDLDKQGKKIIKKTFVRGYLLRGQKDGVTKFTKFSEDLDELRALESNGGRDSNPEPKARPGRKSQAGK